MYAAMMRRASCCTRRIASAFRTGLSAAILIVLVLILVLVVLVLAVVLIILVLVVILIVLILIHYNSPP